MRIMIMPGHSHWDCGAVNDKFHISEWEIVQGVANKLFENEDFDQHDIVFKSRNKSYSALAGEVNTWNPELVLELHCNSASCSVQGSEVLVTKGSSKGAKYGKLILDSLVEEFGFPNRGVKELAKGDRGSKLLYGTKAPTVIVEGYFISGITESQAKKDFLIDKYANAIYNALSKM